MSLCGSHDVLQRCWWSLSKVTVLLSVAKKAIIRHEDIAKTAFWVQNLCVGTFLTKTLIFLEQENLLWQTWPAKLHHPLAS